MSSNIAFLGLGAIGYPMAANIRRKMPKNDTLYVFDIFKPACVKFVDELSSFGPIVMVESPRKAAEGAATVISMVPGPREVEKVYLDASDGIVAASNTRSRLLIECSTIDTPTARKVAKAIQDAGRGVYVDAPVSGGVPAAEKGTLSFMIGHPEPSAGDVNNLNIVLAMMGDPEKFFWCGNVGAGLAAKISNNYISCSVLLLVAEAMAIGTKSGIDPKLLHRIIHNSTGQTFMGDNVCPVPGVVPHAPSSNDWRLGFKTQMFIKDISLGIEAAKSVNIHPTMAEAALGVFEKASVDPRCVDRDGSSVYLHITNDKSP
ncbi:NAD binding domain of 6-phosphogluconate dehydrogenase-domain-containing protein [Ilyonectria sp. MPI-CAGE-AT-0026]|nr:NAD binding domain of 6-phosphogluconate dehydrogenase-domain-containing protein [Ilyonectria sp. MPI-CAGE-AT-0026]